MFETTFRDMAWTFLECAKNVLPTQASEIYEPSIIIFIVAKIVFLHPMSEQAFLECPPWYSDQPV